LIGQAVAQALVSEGYPTVAIARRFTRAQSAAFGERAIVSPIVGLDPEALAALLQARGVDIVVNCLGVLQDSPQGRTRDVHHVFVAVLLKAIAAQPGPILLMHVSIPGREEDDATPFSRTKRESDRLITSSALPHVIMKPGFVIAPAAYGGSALVRALAALPFRMPHKEAGRAFSATAVDDIARTVALVARRWGEGERDWRAVWEIAGREPGTVGGVIETFRRHFGGPTAILSVPGWLLRAGARAGDGVARLGWAPPVRTTALREMLRGVAADPERWVAETGIEPVPLLEVVGRLPSTVQERWFARLFLAKPLMIAGLVVFWIASGLIALTVAFGPAIEILTSHGFPVALARAVTVISSLTDIAVGLAIAWRRTCKTGLLAGIAVSLFYMAGAALVTPDLWFEPLGALVKTWPAIVLMLVTMLVLDER
jgi:uncharacterized protein YbjT (DUF2867 family)